MNRIKNLLLIVLVVTIELAAQVTSDVPLLRPNAIVDLSTEVGVNLFKGEWRYSDAKIIDVDFKNAGPDLKASGQPNKTQDIFPKAGDVNFDDSKWEVLDPSTLYIRRSTGKLSFNWYRISLTVPEKVGELSAKGSKIVFEIVLDDYCEIWINGSLPLVLGQSGGQLIRGFNSPNRVVLTDDAQPGEKFQLAVFGVNGPLSNPPSNFIWIRSATIEIYNKEKSSTGKFVETKINKLDESLDNIISPDTKIEKLAGGFLFTEGPVWVKEGNYLLFSDPNANVIYRWSEDGQVSVFKTKSGYAGINVGEYNQPGSNGLTLDPEGRLTINEHGNRRVVRLEKNGQLTVLADSYNGKRLNSPNDLVYRSDGTLFFTDPAFGLPKVYDDPRKELPYQGVYSLKDGKLNLIVKDLKGPNGIAFSPDEKYLYVGDWDDDNKVVMRYEINSNGLVENTSLFANLTSFPGEDAIDGIKVDQKGNVYVSGPGGLWIYSSDGKALGSLQGPEHPHNLAWGDDGRTLYLTAMTGLYRIRLNIPGATLWYQTELLGNK